MKRVAAVKRNSEVVAVAVTGPDPVPGAVTVQSVVSVAPGAREAAVAGPAGTAVQPAGTAGSTRTSAQARAVPLASRVVRVTPSEVSVRPQARRG